MAESKTHGPATQLAIRNLRSLKPEHQTLLGQLLEDQGMATATLETLVEHLFEEEDPRLTMALARVRAGASVEAVSAASVRSGTTVGSLRARPGTDGRSGSVGSLRGR